MLLMLKSKPSIARLKTALAVSLFALYTPFFQPVQAATSVKAVELQQFHNMSGKQKLYLSPKAIRVEHPNSGVILIGREPFKEVLVLNPKTKCYARKKVDSAVRKLKNVSIVLGATELLAEVPWKKVNDETMNGVKSSTFMKRSDKKSWKKLWTLKEPAFPEKVVKMICTYCGGMPALEGIPLRMEEYIMPADKKEMGMEATPAERDVVFETTLMKERIVPDKLFSVPADYKLTEGSGKVMRSSTGFHSYKEMMESPDFLFQSSKEKLQIDKTKQQKSKSTEKQPGTKSGTSRP